MEVVPPFPDILDKAKGATLVTDDEIALRLALDEHAVAVEETQGRRPVQIHGRVLVQRREYAQCVRGRGRPPV